MSQRAARPILIVSALAASWLGMQALHELGHVLGAWSSGGTVERVVLDPLSISRTDVGHNPHPLTTVWAGPALGCLAPLLLLLIAEAVRFSEAFLLRFFAGFCLVANGGYIFGGSFHGEGDCGEMLRNGTPMWSLWVFGAATAGVGVSLWHGLGPHFGLGPSPAAIQPRAVVLSVAAACVFLAIGFASR